MAVFTDWDVTEVMIQYGGSFVQGLGKLFRQADADNAARLKATFPEYWTEYSEIVRTKGLHASKDASQ